MATNNNFVVTGFVAVDAKVVKNDNGSAWARFPLSIRATHKDKDGNEKKISALQNIEMQVVVWKVTGIEKIEKNSTKEG